MPFRPALPAFGLNPLRGFRGVASLSQKEFAMSVTVQERPLEKIISGLLSKYSLVRIEFTVTTTKIINARAIPEAHHPQVAVVRQAELEKAAVMAGGSLSIQEAQRITMDAPLKPIAVAYGDTFHEVLQALTRELKTLK
jgi:hypothetical protein